MSLKYIIITTPLQILVLLTAGLILIIKNAVTSKDTSTNIISLFTLLWVSFPVLYCLIKKPNIYDGLRQFLFLLPGISVIASLAVHSILEKTKKTKIKIIAVIFLASVILLTIIDYV